MFQLLSSVYVYLSEASFQISTLSGICKQILTNKSAETVLRLQI